VEVPHVDYRALQSDRGGESSSSVRARVEAARGIQRARLASTPWRSNAEMGSRALREHCQLDGAGDRHLEACVRRFGLSGRAVYRILRVARTCADLSARERIAPADVAEAIALRALDREVVSA
jgi:magnesium chelatase family protein